MTESKYCVCCGHDGSFYPIDREHTKTKGSGGSDESFNVSYMCRKHHVEKGMKGITYMANKYPSYHRWLVENGWEFSDFLKKWCRY